MRQEEMLLQLKELIQEEQLIKKKNELKPLINSLKKMLGEIKTADDKITELQQQIMEKEIQIVEMEEMSNTSNVKITEIKEKLYGNKGGSLKELLSFQQLLQKMEEDVAKTEMLYLEEIKQMEDSKSIQSNIKTNNKAAKKVYNEDVKVYKEKTEIMDKAIAENEKKQAKIRKDLTPETLNLYLETIKRFPANPISVLQGETCSGCHITSPSILLVKIREGKKLYRCDSCGRILINIPDIQV